MSRRILYIIDSLKIGGAEMLLLGLLDAVAARGDEAHVAYFSPGPLEEEVRVRGVGLTRLSRRGLRDPRAVIRALRLIRDWRADLVHTHLVKRSRRATRRSDRPPSPDHHPAQYRSVAAEP